MSDDISRIAASTRRKKAARPATAIATIQNLTPSLVTQRIGMKKGGGASPRGSHGLALSGSGCEWAFFFSKFIKLVAKGGKKADYYRDFGTLLHTVQAYYWANKLEVKPDWFTEQSCEEAMTRDSLGNAEWLANAKEQQRWWLRYAPSLPWHPLNVEEVFTAKVSDLDPTGQDEPAIHHEKIDRVTGLRIELNLPTLNDEVVTCRPDLVVVSNGLKFNVDHKSKGGDRKGSGRLPILDESRPDREYVWQMGYNEHVIRHTIPDLAGSLVNRIKRDSPFDSAQDDYEIPQHIYKEIPRTVRMAVKRDRDLLVKCFLDDSEQTPPASLVPAPYQCVGHRYPCSYIPICYSSSSFRESIIKTDFNSNL